MNKKKKAQPVFTFFNDELHKFKSLSNRVVPGLMRPSLSAGPSGMMEAMKIPRSSLPVLSSPTITKPERQTGAFFLRKQFTDLIYDTVLINSPKPSFRSFFKVTHTISLSGELRVGVSTARVA